MPAGSAGAPLLHTRDSKGRRRGHPHRSGRRVARGCLPGGRTRAGIRAWWRSAMGACGPCAGVAHHCLPHGPRGWPVPKPPDIVGALTADRRAAGIDWQVSKPRLGRPQRSRAPRATPWPPRRHVAYLPLTVNRTFEEDLNRPLGLVTLYCAYAEEELDDLLQVLSAVEPFGHRKRHGQSARSSSTQRG